MEHNETWTKWAKKCDATLGTHTMQYLEDDVYFNRNGEDTFSYVCADCGFEYVACGKRNIECQCCGKRKMEQI
jgi:hypothetical protein